MIEVDMTEVVQRHGSHLFVMSQCDWESFTKRLKKEEPELYEKIKKKFNFNITPIDITVKEAF